MGNWGRAFQTGRTVDTKALWWEELGTLKNDKKATRNPSRYFKQKGISYRELDVFKNGKG